MRNFYAILFLLLATSALAEKHNFVRAPRGQVPSPTPGMMTYWSEEDCRAGLPAGAECLSLEQDDGRILDIEAARLENGKLADDPDKRVAKEALKAAKQAQDQEDRAARRALLKKGAKSATTVAQLREILQALIEESHLGE